MASVSRRNETLRAVRNPDNEATGPLTEPWTQEGMYLRRAVFQVVAWSLLTVAALALIFLVRRFSLDGVTERVVASASKDLRELFVPRPHRENH